MQLNASEAALSELTRSSRPLGREGNPIVAIPSLLVIAFMIHNSIIQITLCDPTGQNLLGR